jgi:hypothetical protein
MEIGLRARVQNHVGRRLASFVEVETITRVRAEWIGINRLVLE